jgi:cytochrome c
MKRFVAVCMLLLGLSQGALVKADAKLASEKNCLACHDVSAKRLGPSFRDVSARYVGQKDAVDKLTQKVLKGGAGAWGTMPMPANPQVSETDARKLVTWVLSQR